MDYLLCKLEDQRSIYSAAKAVLAVLKDAARFAFPAHTSAEDAAPSQQQVPGRAAAPADFHREGTGDTFSPLAAVSPYVLEENTAVVLVPQELHTSTLYLSILSKKAALITCWQQLSKTQFMCM